MILCDTFSSAQSWGAKCKKRILENQTPFILRQTQYDFTYMWNLKQMNTLVEKDIKFVVTRDGGDMELQELDDSGQKV